jgi:uncharacterized repeat protein (TIGR03806 family)
VWRKDRVLLIVHRALGLLVFLFLAAGLPACTGEIVAPPCDACAPGRHGPVPPPGRGAGPSPSDPAAQQTCRAVAPPARLVDLAPAFPGLPALNEPVALARPPGGHAWYVLERHGRVRRFEARPGANTMDEVVDLTAEVDAVGDGGLVAAAFHPRFAATGKLFLSYTALGGTVMRSRVIMLASDDGGEHFPAASRRVLFDFDQDNPWRIHLNADLQFGPDGFLYAGFGDGSPQGDPQGRAQDRSDYRGKILRVDVDHGEPYAVPADNPFVHQGGMPEIYALGLRNPWRFTFDRQSGTLWAGDVGAYTWEEIDRIPAGGNMGWPIHEGNSCLGGGPCDSDGFVAPVVDYPHPREGAAVVGGFVYHGAAIPALTGRYLFADYARGDLFALSAEGQPELLASTGRRLVSFAEETNGELLLVDLAGGEILRVEPAAPEPGLVADRLSQTGCFLASDPSKPARGLIPYEVRVPFWSDGAEKRRFLALPAGEHLTVRGDGRLVLPVGAVLAKQFFLAGRPIETRLMMKYRDTQWVGYSYAWDEAGTDAVLVPNEGITLDRGAATWSYPSRGDCLGCHNQDRGLGLEVSQLEAGAPRPGAARVADSLASLERLGLVDGDVPSLAPLPLVDGKAPLELRARSYLHENCSICHTREGPTPVDMDLRFTTPLAQTRLCGVLPTEGSIGVTEAARLVPGHPARSILSVRMRAHGRDHMPPIGPREVDEHGAALVDAWIQKLAGCP